MRMKKILVCVMVLLLTCTSAFAQEIPNDEINSWAVMLKSLIASNPNCKGSLNMVKPFQPIQMEASSLEAKGRAFYAEIGIATDLIDDVIRFSGEELHFEDNQERLITLVYRGYENDHCFVFEKNEQGVEYLVDVVYGSYPSSVSADLVELKGGRYLLTNVNGHGSGSMANWTSWYSLENRRVELYTLREAYESYYPVVAEVVTKTNVDHKLSGNRSDAETTELITYTYTTVYTSFNETRNQYETVVDDECTVRIYHSSENGLVLIGERVFDTYTPAILEQKSVDELMNDEWQLVMDDQGDHDTASPNAYIGQVHPSLPMLTLTVTDTGERKTELIEDNILQVSIEALDGSPHQTLTWESRESPESDRIVSLARLKDLNFDGYSDLLLLAAEGAQNVYFAFSLWDVEKQQFRPVYRDCVWLREEARFSDEVIQIELCNPEIFPEQQILLSSDPDGFYYTREIFYMFDGSYHLTSKYIWDVYRDDDGMIRETMVEYMTRLVFLWDETYPEDWYYGLDGTGASNERRKAAHEVALGGANQQQMQVAIVDWVNLRKQDSKASLSLAKINEGENVTVLVDDCGPENGWVRVLYSLGEHHTLSQDELDTGRTTLTGYIWHSFLEPVE